MNDDKQELEHSEDSTQTGDNGSSPPTSAAKPKRAVRAGNKATKQPKKKPHRANESPVTPVLLAVVMLPVDELHPSGWNPNQVPKDGFAALCDEVKGLGKPPKPIVVTPARPGYRIVDGEHSWRACKTVGLAEVPCEIFEMDIFEAMRQTLVRNRHGEDNPVLLGHLYQRMMLEGKLTNRQLAKELDLSEGTIRNYLNYVKAEELRKCYAPKEAQDRISKLHIDQVKAYLDLPDDRRDKWLDSGADLKQVERLKAAPTQSQQKAKATKKPAPASDNPTLTEAVPSQTADQNEESVDPTVLNELEDRWKRANTPTREKFLSCVLAEPSVREVTLRMIEQE